MLNQSAKERSITFVLDAAQKIYPKSFTWKEVGLSIQPRHVYTLRNNYRNTKQIAAFIKPILTGVDIGDDGALPNLDTCLRDGPKPIVIAGLYNRQADWVISNLAKSINLEKESVVFLKPAGGKWFNELKNRLRLAGLPYVELIREAEWPQGDENIALCTMHSAKGLEFDHVVIIGLNQELTPHGLEAGDVTLENLKRLFAMACGRARQSVTIGYKPGCASSLIDCLDPATFDEVNL